MLLDLHRNHCQTATCKGILVSKVSYTVIVSLYKVYFAFYVGVPEAYKHQLPAEIWEQHVIK